MLLTPSKYTNVAANATTVVRTGGGLLFSATCHNANAASRYLQFFDLAVVPTSTTTVPALCFLVPTASQIIVGMDLFTELGWKYSTGLAWAFSTTRDVYTAGSAGDQQTTLFYQ